MERKKSFLKSGDWMAQNTYVLFISGKESKFGTGGGVLENHSIMLVTSYVLKFFQKKAGPFWLKSAGQ